MALLRIVSKRIGEEMVEDRCHCFQGVLAKGGEGVLSGKGVWGGRLMGGYGSGVRDGVEMWDDDVGSWRSVG